MAAGPTPQAPDTIPPIGPPGPVPTGRGARAPGAPTSSSASLKWPPAPPLKPPTRSHQSAPRGPSPRDAARAPPWERRRPRRHLLNGRRPHPSSPRHDPPNRPLGGGRSTPADETSAFPASADPGRLAVRLSEHFFGFRISGFAAIVLKNERLNFASSSTRSQALLSTLG
jgi:hypothetical protein